MGKLQFSGVAIIGLPSVYTNRLYLSFIRVGIYKNRIFLSCELCSIYKYTTTLLNTDFII